MMQRSILLPFDVALLPVKKLSAGKLTCLYEYGNLRSIHYGDEEVIRMIYTAVRDEHWNTAPYEIHHEKIEERDNSFSISYTAFYHLHTIRYKADITIEGNADEMISFSMKGEALSTFNRNRIGICVLHPIEPCAGKTAEIKQPGGSHYTAVFPKMISPHQPFKDIQEMKWPLNKGTAQLDVEGDIFETEDQRNWGDNSYKTYSTPHDLPIPVLVKAGETIKQKVVLKVGGSGNNQFGVTNENIPATETKVSFPKIGYCRTNSGESLTDKEITLLRQLPFDHYRVVLYLNNKNWQRELETAITEAKKLETLLELIIFYGQHIKTELASLVIALEKAKDHIESLLLLLDDEEVTSATLLQEVYPQLKKMLPNTKLGYGTNGFFADLNRNRPDNIEYDFVSYSLNPQVHLTDTRTIIENVAAQPYLIETTRTFIKDATIHISPITFKPRSEADDNANEDPRLHTAFGAFWTLAAIKNLGDAAHLTFYQTKGSMGLLKSENEADEIILYPVYDVLAQLKSFQPKWIITNNRNSASPLEPVVFENEKGERLAFMIDAVKTDYRS